MKKGLISIVVPVYNESLNVNIMYDRVVKTFRKLDYNYEIIYVDNCSRDNTVERVEELIKKDPNVFCILMSRNFGSSQPSIMAGVSNAKGDAVVVIEGDVQDPPELVEEFIKKWEEGYHVVYGIRKKRKGSLLRRMGYKAFYRLFKKMSYVDMPLDAGDFALMDRLVVDEIKKLRENEIFFRGLRAWVGFRQTGIEYVREDRQHGETSISFMANFKWAKMGIFNFSYKPLEWISGLAAVLTVISLIGIIYYVVQYFIQPNMPRGFSTIVVLILFLSSIQFLALAVIGEYIARIFNEIKGRPRYIIRDILHNDSLKDKEEGNNKGGDRDE